MISFLFGLHLLLFVMRSVNAVEATVLNFHCHLRSDGRGEASVVLPPAGMEAASWLIYLGDQEHPYRFGQLSTKAVWLAFPLLPSASGMVATCLSFDHTGLVLASSTTRVTNPDLDATSIALLQAGATVLGALVACAGIMLQSWLLRSKEERQARADLKGAILLWLEKELRHLRTIGGGGNLRSDVGIGILPEWLKGNTFPLHARAAYRLGVTQLIERAEAIFQDVKSGAKGNDCIQALQDLITDFQQR